MSNEHGVGGSYLIDEHGERKLVERTRDPNDPAEPPEPAEPQEPATSAGFLLGEAISQPAAPKESAADNTKE